MYDKELLRKLAGLKEFKTIDKNGKLFTSSNDVYNKISNAIAESGSRMTVKHIYTTLTENRNGVFDFVIETFLTNATEIRNTKHMSNISEENSLNSLTSENSLIDNEFTVVISAQKWYEIQLDKKDKNTSLTLKINVWTDVIADAIYEQKNYLRFII